MQKIKIQSIWYVANTYGLGGAETFGTDLLKSLQQEKIYLTAFTNHQPLFQLWQNQKINAVLLPATSDFLGDWKGLIKSGYHAPREIFSYWRLLVSAKQQPDAIILSGFSSKIFLTFLAYFYDIPVIWLEFGPYGETIDRFFKLPRLLYNLVKKLPQLVIVPTEYTKQAMIHQLDISPTKLKVIPCGRRFEFKLTNLPVKKNDSKVKVIICPSRFEQGKGQDILVKAFVRVFQVLPNTKLVFTGNDNSEFGQEVKTLVKRLGLDDQVVFKGWVESVPAEIMKADICVFPSVWSLEGFGMVQIEAMALAKPVIAFNRGPTNEIVLDQKTGVLVSSINDVSALALAIIKLLRNPLLSQRLGQAGRRRFLRRYHMDTIIDDYLEAFKWAKAAGDRK